MSELRAALALAVALLAARPLRAQTIPDLRGRIARLEVAQKLAVAAQHRVDSARSTATNVQLDTARHAGLTLLAIPWDAALARAAVAEAWPALERSYGAHAAELARKDFHLIVSRNPDAPTGLPRDPQFDEQRRRDVYQEMVIAPWMAVRRCFIGDIGRCRQAFGLVGGPHPATDWYDPDDRARAAGGTASWASSTGQEALRKSCLFEHR